MAFQILATKLYIPPPPFKIVARPRLIDRLNHGLSANHKLTLISAPAGFGKSTVVSEWLASSRRPTAWLSLDEHDHELARFLIYVISALQTISPNMGTGVLEVLQAQQLPAIEAVLTALLNEISSIKHEFIL